MQELNRVSLNSCCKITRLAEGEFKLKFNRQNNLEIRNLKLFAKKDFNERVLSKIAEKTSR